MDQTTQDVVRNQIGDDKLVRVFRKMREKLREETKVYEAKAKELKESMAVVEAELLRRLQERGAKQTKTEDGTAFISETMTASIADEDQFFGFVRETGDLDFFQKRVSVTHLQEFMKEHKGVLPPGLNIFRELGINVRAPRQDKQEGEGE